MCDSEYEIYPLIYKYEVKYDKNIWVVIVKLTTIKSRHCVS